MKSKKLKLNDLKVKSFQTSNQSEVKGGNTRVGCDDGSLFEACNTQFEPCQTAPATFCNPCILLTIERECDTQLYYC